MAQQGPGLPPGKWWNRPEIVNQLKLSDDQRMQLDRIFRANAPNLIDLKGTVEKRSLDLRGQLDQQQLNRASIQAAAARLSEARSQLFEHELMMFVDMRAILTPDQWNRFRERLDMNADRQQGGRQRKLNR